MDIMINPGRLSGEIKAQPSKSVLHRALICAALSDGECEVKNVACSDDITATVNCLRALGAEIIRTEEGFKVTPIDFAKEQEAELNCGESGTTLRFMLALVCALGRKAVLNTSGRLSQRPVSGLCDELVRHGAVISRSFPLSVNGQIAMGDYTVPGNISSQYVSALLIALSVLPGDSRVHIEGAVSSSSYIDITVDILRRFGADVEKSGNDYRIKGRERLQHSDITVEGDWSSSAVWLCAGAGVKGLSLSSLQGDRKIVDILLSMGAKRVDSDALKFDCSSLSAVTFDGSQCLDIIPAAAVLCAFAEGTSEITNVSNLVLKESDRLKTIADMLKAVGVEVSFDSSTLKITGTAPKGGGTVDPQGDHRIAMAAAVLALGCSEPVKVINAECVNKSYPGFFNDFIGLGGDCNVLQLRK